MMRRLPGILAALLFLSGCDHHHPESDGDSNAAIPIARSTQHGSPRAKLVALPRPPAPAGAPAPMVAHVSTETAASTPIPPPPAPLMGAPELSAPPPPQSLPAPHTMADSTPSPTPEAPDTNAVASVPQTPPPPPPPPPMSENEERRQVVVLDTSFGQIVIQLDDVAAPRTCGNFRKLVSAGFYNHTIFHRVIPNFMIQGGDPNSKTDERAIYGQGDPGYTLPAEIGLKHTAGAVAMARLPDAMNPKRESNGSQFYICVGPCPSLDEQYTVFGHVIAGMDVVAKIANQPRDSHDDPTTRIEMQAELQSKKQALETAGK